MAINVSWQLSALSLIASTARWSDEICITSNHTISLHPRFDLFWLLQRILTIITQAIQALLAALLGRRVVLIDYCERREELTSTVNYLKATFGTHRVERDFTWCGINTKTLYDEGRCLSKQDFASLFHSFELVTKEDIDELLAELNTDAASIRGIEGERLQDLRRAFAGKKEISSCSPEEIRTLEKILLPFARPKDQFWNHPEERAQTVPFPVTPFTMLESVAWTLHVLRTKKVCLKDFESLFGKCLAQPRLPKHLIVPHPNNGYLFFSHLIETSGASKRFFKSFHPQSVPPVILYRGTRGPMPGDTPSDTVNSLLEDLRLELGASGPIATYEETKELLENPSRGFIDTPDQQVVLIGNSIGGAQSQRDAVLFHDRVLRLTTNCSPGIDKETAALFRKVMSRPRSTPMVITHNIDKGDVVDSVGDEHLGGECPNTTLTFRSLVPATPAARQETVSWTTARRLHDFLFSGIPALASNIAGIIAAHGRATCLGEYQEEAISTEDLATRDLAIAYAEHRAPTFDPSWEQARRCFCPIVSPGFADFARQHVQRE